MKRTTNCRPPSPAFLARVARDCATLFSGIVDLEDLAERLTARAARYPSAVVAPPVYRGKPPKPGARVSLHEAIEKAERALALASDHYQGIAMWLRAELEGQRKAPELKVIPGRGREAKD